MRKALPFMLAAVLTLSACVSSKPADKSKVTTEEKVAQLLMVRCDRDNMDTILEKQPGGIVMFGVDFNGFTEKEVKNTIKSYKKACDIEPIISVDEEGGTVVRVSSNPELAPEKYQSPQYYYNLGGMEAIEENVKEKSRLLADLGITMNLAPVADVSTDPADFIYDRSLGQDAQTTADYIAAAVQAASSEGIMSCLKHFPGYGNNVDTHTGIAIDERPIEQLQACDFLPFKSGSDADASAMMVSHNIIASVDSNAPASISPAVHALIRDEIGFNGIVMTDDMAMQAVSEYETPYAKAVLAGNDMIITSNFNTAYNEILEAVNNGTIPVEMLDNAVSRILNIKGLYGLKN